MLVVQRLPLEVRHSTTNFPINRRDRLQLAMFLVVALWVIAACGCRREYISDRAPTLSAPAVARMMSEGTFHCTAWKVSERFAMTAGHCCQDGASYTLEGAYAVSGAEMTVVVDDDAHDVCVLRGPMQGAPIVLASQDPPIGAIVWTVGYPRSVYLISEGVWSGRSRIDKDDYYAGICSAVSGFGASGSPVMDVQGRAVGVLSRRYPEMDNLLIASPVEWMRSALRKALLQPVQ